MAEQTKIARRTLFAGAGLIAAAGLAVKLVPKPVASGLSGPVDEAENTGYRLTEHIKKYYRTTTI